MLYSFVGGPDSPSSCEQLLHCAGDDLSSRVDAQRLEDVARRNYTVDARELAVHQM